MSSTTLVIPTRAAKAIKPPLKKSEIIHALATRKYQQLCAEVNERRARKQQLEAKLTAIVDKLTHEGGQRSTRWTNEYVNVGRDQSRYERRTLVIDMSRTIRFEDLPTEARTIVREINQLNNTTERTLDFADIKREIRNSMTGQTTEPSARINALLNDPATQKLLDRTLRELEAPKKTQLAA